MTETTKGPEGQRLPTADEERHLWRLIEEAWAGLGPEVNRARQALARRDPDDEADDALVHESLAGFLENLGRLSAGLTGEELTSLDRVVERKLYELDRAEVHEVTDGSDDGFLYCRGFIVALGKEFFDVVNDEPSKAVVDAECEEMCYFFAHVHEKRFGRWPETGSGISRESSSNPAGWASLRRPGGRLARRLPC